MKISENVIRKLHYAAYNNGILKAAKNFLKEIVPKASEDIIKVIDECIEINEKLGNGYKLCKIDEDCIRREEVIDRMMRKNMPVGEASTKERFRYLQWLSDLETIKEVPSVFEEVEEDE